MTDNSSKKSRKKQDLINYYDALGIDNIKALQKEIRAKYTKLAIKYHPDKNKDNPDYNPELFELIQKAWECLGNEDKRKEYDKLLGNVEKAKKSDHFNLKQSFDNYSELSKSEVGEKSNDLAKLEFKKHFDDMDRKHKFDRKKLDDGALDTTTSKKRVADLLMQREQEEIEYGQNRLFEGKVDMSKFNAVFDKYKNSTEKQLVKKNVGPSAFNETGSSNGNFSTLDIFDNTYDESEIDGNDVFGSVNFGVDSKLDIDADEIVKIKEADYTTNHDKNRGADFQKEMERRLAERDSDYDTLKNLKHDEFLNDPKDAFMFTHEVGAVDEFSSWDDDDDLIDACNKLIALEKKK
jgi:curved DNA-binding protein CbpA